MPIGPPPRDLIDLPLSPVADEPAFLRPKQRARVRRVRRGWSSRLVLVLQLVGAGLIAGAAVWTTYAKVMASDRLKVGKVDVRGSHFLSEGEVRELLGPAVGENILSLDIEGLKGRLRASPWVADAVVERALPDTIRVEIKERVPLALVEMERLYLMDGDGGLIDIYGPRTASFDLPIVRGLQDLPGESRRDRAQRAGALLRDLAELAAEVSEVYVEPSGDIKVVLRGPGEVLLLGDPPYRKRFATFLSLRRELSEKAPGTEYFDLRFRGRIFAKGGVAAKGGDAAKGGAASERKTPARPARAGAYAFPPGGDPSRLGERAGGGSPPEPDASTVASASSPRPPAASINKR